MGCDIRKTIETAFSGRMPLGLDVSVYGSGTTKQKEPLHVYREKRPQSAYRESDDTTLKQLYELKLGGHKWSLLVKPSPQFLRKTGTSQPAVMAGLVLVFACSGSLFLWIMARKERRSRQLAESRADVIEKLEKTQSRLRETLTDLRRAEHILADQERQKALSSVAKGIAHDFNNALSPVRGYADLLLENPDQLTDEETVRRYVQRIKKATDAATETVRRMSKFYHDGNVDNHGPLDVNDMVTEAIDLARDSMQEGMGEITKRINWITEFHSTGDIYAAEDEVREMLANVICNSMEAIQEAGTIQVRTHSERNNVFIAIEDDGVGMDDETLLSCTDPFFTTKGPDTRGLGLSVSEGIVARHGGSLRVNSEEGGGTTVLIKWPTASTGEGRECEAAEGALPEGLSFLIIGNQKLERTLLSDLLRSLGYEVKISATARGGVEECAEQNYDVVIVGTHLQNMRLKECLEQLSAQGKPPRVIVSTDETFENGEKWEEYSDLVDDWLPKPIQLESLRSTIRKVVSEG